METDLRDMYGKKIQIGDRLKFAHYDGCEWVGLVIFEDGVVTVDPYDAMQIKNPTKWEQTHDWIKSRWWSCTVGYGEFGSWNCPRNPLSKIADMWRDYDLELKPLYDKYGHSGGRILKAAIVLN